jgi:hypothetical protein
MKFDRSKGGNPNAILLLADISNRHWDWHFCCSEFICSSRHDKIPSMEI